MYLEFLTWPEAGFDEDAIRGQPADFARLATLVENKLAAALPSSSVLIGEDFAPNTPYGLVLNLREDGFDPATADTRLPAEDVHLDV